jgi:hypothetical protein
MDALRGVPSLLSKKGSAEEVTHGDQWKQLGDIGRNENHLYSEERVMKTLSIGSFATRMWQAIMGGQVKKNCNRSVCIWRESPGVGI